MSLDTPQPRPDLDELLGAYALDAVDRVERAEIEHYLAASPVARRELDELRETAAMLQLTQRNSEPAPESLWARIQDAIGDDTVQSAQITVPIDLGAQRERRHTRSLAALTAVAVAAAIAIGVLGVNVATHDDHSGDLAAAYHHTAAAGREIAIATLSDKSVVAHIAFGRDGTGYLRNDGLKALPSGRVYQLWVFAADKKEPISAGILGPHPSMAAFKFYGKVAAFAISEEQAPGAVSPTKAVASGTA